MIDIRSLTGVPFETLTAAFNDAFSDYAIPANYPTPYMTGLLARRGYRADLAVGAFDGDRLVGFVFNCLDGERAYNSGTGVAISHRRQGIARKLMQRSIETLPAAQYILEVIETNTKAEALYRALGFVETRRLQSWAYVSVGRAAGVGPALAGRSGKPVLTRPAKAGPTLEAIRSWCDVAPSWQNDTPSIRRANEPYEIVGDDEGGVVVFPSNGDVAQFAVRRDARRRGRGRALLDAAAATTSAPLRIINLDDGDRGIRSFLEACKARPLVRQLEMVRTIR